MADKTVHRAGVLEKLRRANAISNRTYYPAPGVWLRDGTVLFSATYLDANNIWSIHVDPDGTVPGEPRHWSDGTEVELYPDAVVTAKGSIHAVYAALSTASSIWRIPLTPGGECGGEPELLTAMYRAGSPSLSADGRIMAFSARRQLGETIQLAELGGPTPVASSTIRPGSIRPVLSGDGRAVAWTSGDTGFIMAIKGDTPEGICRGCGLPTHVNFGGTKAIFEAGVSSKAEELQLAVKMPAPCSTSRIAARGCRLPAVFRPMKAGWHSAGGTQVSISGRFWRFP